MLPNAHKDEYRKGIKFSPMQLPAYYATALIMSPLKIKLTQTNNYHGCCINSYITASCNICNFTITKEVFDYNRVNKVDFKIEMEDVIQKHSKKYHSENILIARVKNKDNLDHKMMVESFNCSLFTSTDIIHWINKKRKFLCGFCAKNIYEDSFEDFYEWLDEEGIGEEFIATENRKLMKKILGDVCNTLNNHFNNSCENVEEFKESAEARVDMLEILNDYLKKSMGIQVGGHMAINWLAVPGSEYIFTHKKCDCGRINIITCKICKSVFREELTQSPYGHIIRKHFGKTKTNYNYTDFIIQCEKKLEKIRVIDGINTDNGVSAVDNANIAWWDRMILVGGPQPSIKDSFITKYDSYKCVICGIQYEINNSVNNSVNNINNLPPEEVVLEHFKKCVADNCDYFANNGYKCF